MRHSLKPFNGEALSFEADVGIDAEVFPGENGAASVQFAVVGDGKELFATKILKGKREAEHIKVDLAGGGWYDRLMAGANKHARKSGYLYAQTPDGSSFRLFDTVPLRCHLYIEQFVKSATDSLRVRL